MRIVGIDPGVKGALAVIDPVANTLAVIDMPLETGTKGKNMVSSQGVLELLRAASPEAVFLEQVWSSPQQGVVSAFSFGDGYGTCRTAALATEAALWLVRPTEWKGKTLTPKDKKQAVTRATQLFPSARHAFQGPRGGGLDGRAEAAILAFYGCLTLKQVPTKPLKLIEYPNA